MSPLEGPAGKGDQREQDHHRPDRARHRRHHNRGRSSSPGRHRRRHSTDGHQGRTRKPGSTIFWAPPASTGGTPITSYYLCANGISKEVSASTRRWTFTKLRAGWTYKLYVSARNAEGRSVNATVLVKVHPAITH